MPASIAHMLIAREARKRLLTDGNPKVAEFAADVLGKHPHYMELGSLGPDLPYFGWRSLLDSNKPRGVDHWSYQLHSKCPNVFPLQMIELVWRESDPTKTDWEDHDKCKLSFLCGYLTHMAADQVIHPLVNVIAGGPYDERQDVRTRHRDCEIHQDLYLLSRQNRKPLTRSQFTSESFNSWCNPKLDGWSTSKLSEGSVIGRILDALWMAKKKMYPPPCPLEFIYFLQRAFVEAHAVTPKEEWVEHRIKSLKTGLLLGKYWPWSWYNIARQALFADDGSLKKDSDAYMNFIHLRQLPKKQEGSYDDYVDEANELATVYIRAAYELSRAPRLDDDLRKAFREVVVNADLGVPLELHILRTAKENCPRLTILVEHKWAIKWLEDLDQGHYVESWDAAAESWKSVLTKDDFVNSMKLNREPMGKVISRKQKRTNGETTKTLPVVGDCMTIQCETSFVNGATAVEAMTVVLDENESWKVSDYKISPAIPGK